MQHLFSFSVFTLSRRFIMSGMIFLHSLWAAGDIEICLQHEKEADCAKLSVSIPHLQEGRPFEEGDWLFRKLHDTQSVISLSYYPQESNQSQRVSYLGDLRIISTQQAQRDNEGNFLQYYLPIIFNAKYFDDGEGIEGLVFPFTPEKSGWISYELSMTAKKNVWQKIGRYWYRPLKEELGLYEAQEFKKAVFSKKLKIEAIDIQSTGKYIKNPQRPYKEEELTSVRSMPFSNEVSVFGTVWKVCDMWTHIHGEIKQMSLIWKPLNIFPKMTEQQFKGMGLGNSRAYKNCYNNAFFDPNLSILCFFPTKETTESHGHAFTSRSLDIVAHETGHYVFNHMAPRIARSSDIYARSFNESFADCTAYFFLLQFQEIRDLIYDKTKGNLNVSSFFSDIGEGLTGRDGNSPATPLGKTKCQQHALSEAFTKAIYGTLVKAVDHDINTLPRDQRKTYHASEEEVSSILEKTSNDLMGIYLSAILSYNNTYDPSEDFNFIQFGQLMCDKDKEADLFFSNFIVSSFFKEGFNLDAPDQKHPANCSRSSSEPSAIRCSTLTFLS